MDNKVQVRLSLNDIESHVMLPKNLCIIRHTNSWFNHHRMVSKDYPDIMSIFYGNSKWDADIQLSALGKVQGLELMNYWNNDINSNNRYINYVSSSYKRCMDTMKFISSKFETCDNLVEKGAGQYYGYSQEQMIKTFPNYKLLKQDQWNCKIGPENGTPDQFTESYSQVVARAYKALLTLPEYNTVICTHGEVFTSLRYMLEAPSGMTFNEFLEVIIAKDYVQNGEIYEYDFGNGIFCNHRLTTDSHNKMQYSKSYWNKLANY